MSARPFLIEIHDKPSACESLRHLLCSVPMDVQAYSSCERALHAVLRCGSDCLVKERTNRDARIGRLDSQSPDVASDGIPPQSRHFDWKDGVK